MKVLAIAVLAITASTYAQTPPPPQRAPHAQPPTASQQPPQLPQPPAPPANQVEPKHSEATATLRAIEAEKGKLLAQQQSLANEVNTLMASLRAKITAKEADAKAEQDAIRQENGWDESYVYTPTMQLPDGSDSPGKWQHTEKPKK